MDVRLTVPVYEWMREPALLQVMDAMGAGNARMVGGCVRSAVLGEDIGPEGLDIDIATVHRPEEVLARLDAAGIRAVPTGLEHGTVTAIIDGRGFEITTLRHDVVTDGRHAQVAFTKSWYEDAHRRDFTMNTLLMDLEGNVYDPVGTGVDDLLAGRVVFVGDADLRISEDYLRILRFFRFHARYGVGVPDDVGIQACLRSKFHIAKLSRERVTTEYVKLLPAKGAGEVLVLLRDNSILPDVVSQEFNLSVYQKLLSLGRVMGGFFDIKLLFAYSVWRNKANTPYSFLAKYFVLSKSYNRFLMDMFAALDNPYDSFDKNAYVYGREVALGFEVLSFVINDLDGDVDEFLARYKKCVEREIPRLPVSGGDVATIFGLEPGPRIGEILKLAEQWWLSENMQLTRDDLILKIKEIA